MMMNPPAAIDLDILPRVSDSANTRTSAFKSRPLRALWPTRRYDAGARGVSVVVDSLYEWPKSRRAMS